jgi:hypothetical protein
MTYRLSSLLSTASEALTQHPALCCLQDCMRRMLHVDPTQRATAQEVLSHAWMLGMAGQQSPDCWVVM